MKVVFYFMRKILKNPWFVMVLDMILLYLCFVSVFSIRFSGSPIPSRNLQAFHATQFYIFAVFLGLFYVQGLYDFDETDDGVSIFFKVFAVTGAGTVSIMALTFLSRAFAFPRTVIFMSYLLMLVVMSLWRLFIHHSFLGTLPPRGAIVYGDAKWFEIIEGFLKKNVRKYRYDGGVVPGRHEELHSLIEKKGSDCVIITDDVDGGQEVAFRLLIKYPGIIVYVLPRLSDIIAGAKPHLVIGDLPLAAFTNKTILGRYYLMKRFMDLSISLAALIALSPFLLLVAIGIKITSKGPVFYIQPRVGRNGREFRIIKFRTMRQDAEEETGPTLSTGNDDPRVTTIGRYLRKFKIDEVPQFLNVIKGDMSVVGPRPERPNFVKIFEEEHPGYCHRNMVLPGITGLAQVNGLYESDPSVKLKYDLIYIYNYRPLMDITILYQTLQFVIRDNL